MTKIKKGFKRFQEPSKTYVITHCIPPEYDKLFTFEKTGPYRYVRSVLMQLAMTGNFIIIDIQEKNENCNNRKSRIQ